MSLILRDQYIRECWVPSSLRVPRTDPRGAHYPVQCWGIIEDTRFLDEQGAVKRFVDLVSWWPAMKMWTVTMLCAADERAEDVPVTVISWQPPPPLHF